MRTNKNCEMFCLVLFDLIFNLHLLLRSSQFIVIILPTDVEFNTNREGRYKVYGNGIRIIRGGAYKILMAELDEM